MKQMVKRPIGMKFETHDIDKLSLADFLSQKAANKSGKLVSILTTSNPDVYMVILAVTEFAEIEIDMPDEVTTDPAQLAAVAQADGVS
jgi:hypothetical protein